MIVASQDTAVVILSYNSRKWHELFLPKIVEQARQGYDVFVVDHASPDDTSEYIQHHFPYVQLIRLSENHGFAWGYAEALKQIQAKYYILLSSDFEVTDNWFAPIHAAMEADENMAACQPKIRYYRDRAYFEYAGAAGGFMDKWGYLFCRGRIFSTLEPDEGQYDTPADLFWASGGCFVVRSEIYHHLGGLDPDLFAHMEEVDLCWRMKNAGYKIGYVPGSTVFHVGGSIISYGSPQKTFYNFRNSLVLLLKNEKGGKLVWLLPLRLLLDGVAGLQLLASGQVKNILAIMRAHWSFFLSFGKWHRKRLTVKSLVTTRDEKGIYRRSIIMQYFVRGKKKFSQLDPADFK
ncbi:glycosyltransferase family 2 protein [Taibaiella koreensis]|uniref:glycosyltransferase family 2 protein n=1 Tax=Taibaiella koreensis TaxID=1268548 RepID=UPI000E59E39A|nr:glycosyltransferase family 2 protein [Taibaiella koreensis]